MTSRPPREVRIVEPSLSERWRSEFVLPFVVQRLAGPPINDYYPVASFGTEREAKVYKRDLVRQARSSSGRES